MNSKQLASISNSSKRLSEEKIDYLNEKRIILMMSNTNPGLAEMIETMIRSTPRNHL